MAGSASPGGEPSPWPGGELGRAGAAVASSAPQPAPRRGPTGRAAGPGPERGDLGLAALGLGAGPWARPRRGWWAVVGPGRGVGPVPDEYLEAGHRSPAPLISGSAPLFLSLDTVAKRVSQEANAPSPEMERRLSPVPACPAPRRGLPGGSSPRAAALVGHISRRRVARPVAAGGC